MNLVYRSRLFRTLFIPLVIPLRTLFIPLVIPLRALFIPQPVMTISKAVKIKYLHAKRDH